MSNAEGTWDDERNIGYNFLTGILIGIGLFIFTWILSLYEVLLK